MTDIYNKIIKLLEDDPTVKHEGTVKEVTFCDDMNNMYDKVHYSDGRDMFVLRKRIEPSRKK